MKKRAHFILIYLFVSVSLYGQHFDHTLWTSFLQKHVSNDGFVQYKSIQDHPEDLYTYLNRFKDIAPTTDWTKNEILAFWINAYNAFTVKLIIENYPVKSIKDIKKPWDKEFVEIANKKVSLNYIEHNILRKMNEPRIHFTIVCASYSCPKLNNEAYTALKLEDQLTQATKDFLNDPKRNSISENRLELSKLFQWFTKDFKKNGDLIDFLNQYVDITILENAKIKYKDYDWALNE